DNVVGHGLTGMSDRLAALAGDFEVTRRAVGGTIVTFSIPLTGNTDQSSVPDSSAAGLTIGAG
ncbi:MAG: hypothetical protein ABWZ98_17770, partial [Nakamurella sp.]